MIKHHFPINIPGKRILPAIAFVLLCVTAFSAHCQNDTVSRDKSLNERMRTMYKDAKAGDPGAQFLLSHFHSAVAEACNNNGDERQAEKSAKTAFKWAKKAADAGLDSAQSEVATMYMMGYGTKQNTKKGFHYYEKAIAQGFVPALNMMAQVYSKGFGVEENPEMATICYRRSAMMGNIVGQYNYAMRLMTGNGTELSYDSAYYWFGKVHEQGDTAGYIRQGQVLLKKSDAMKEANGGELNDDIRAMEAKGLAMMKEGVACKDSTNHGWSEDMIAICYLTGRGAETDSAEGAKWLRQAAGYNDGTALDALASIELDSAITTDSNRTNSVHFQRCLQLWKRGAEAGNSNCMLNYGLALMNGNGIEADPAGAFPFLMKATRMGDPRAAYFISDYYFYGLYGIEQDYKLTTSLLTMAAQAGITPAVTKLGLMAEEGLGTKKNIDKAFSLYRDASAAGDGTATFRLGLCYYNGKGVKKNVEKAIELWRQATELGNGDACFNVGVCYINGIGVSTDEKEAEKWFRHAVELGNENARGALKNMGKLW